MNIIIIFSILLIIYFYTNTNERYNTFSVDIDKINISKKFTIK